MVNFEYCNPARIIFGQGAVEQLPSLLNEYNVHSLLLINDGDLIKKLGAWNIIKNFCAASNISFTECSKVVSNPKIEYVREIVEIGKKNNVDFVLAFGGGSVIDTAKAVALGISYDADVWDFFTGNAVPTNAIPVGAITTLPASGSETSNCSIISNGLHKWGVEDNIIIPKFAIMDPCFTLGLPPYQTACGCADILSHLLERYFSNELHTDTTDYLIEGAVKALLLNAKRLTQNPQNYDARAEVQWLASIAHNGILDTGRIACWGSHRIEHELSAQYNLAHGEGMAIVFVAWCKYMAENKPAKLAQLANRVFSIDLTDYSDKDAAYILADKLNQFFKSLNLRTSLSELNITDVHFEEMANRATNNDTNTVGHYIPLHVKEIIEILKLAL